MSKSAPSIACKFIFERKKDVVQQLSRTNSGLWIEVGASKSLKTENARLIVPRGIDVYRSLNFRLEEELFFACKSGSETNQAYLIKVSLDKNDSLDYAKNVGHLLKYPWFTPGSSNLVLDRLINGWAYDHTGTKGYHLFSNCVQGEGENPLIK